MKRWLRKMGIAFSIVGLVLIITAAQNTYADLATQLQSDVAPGPGSFLYWLAAVIFVGILGYVPALKTFSTWFMALILLTLLLSHKGFFAQLTTALQQGGKPINSTPKITSAASPAAPSLTPSQGIAQGAAGVGVDWLAPFKAWLGTAAP
jgi:hypothetical protein